MIAALLPIVNPFGGAPVFLAMTADCTAALRATLAQKIAVNAFILLLASLFVGTYVLEFFGLSVPIVQVAGGIVVCANAWELLRAESAAPIIPASAPAAAEIASRAFYPLTLPLTVGPGTISVAITIGAHHPQSVRSLVVQRHRRRDRRGADRRDRVRLLSLRRPDAARAGRNRHQRARSGSPRSSCCASACRSSGPARPRCSRRCPQPRRADARGAAASALARLAADARIGYNFRLARGQRSAVPRDGPFQVTCRCSSVGRAAHS